MRKLTRRRLIWLGICVGVLAMVLTGAAYYLSRRIEPFIQRQTISYLRARYKAEVEIGALHVTMSMRDPLAVLLAMGQGAHVEVKVLNVVIRQTPSTDMPPLIRIGNVTFRVHLPTLWNGPTMVDRVHLQGLELTIPPGGQRPSFTHQASEKSPPSVVIAHVDADGATLVVLPKDASKAPLKFHMQRLHLDSAGPSVAMRYDTVLENPTPPGLIQCHGTFGPFRADSPGESPLTGDYVFTNADLGVFQAIAGTLSSNGRFQGQLNEIVVDGETRTPDFRLTRVGNRVPLNTKFHAVVDGTNGNTLLQPVNATLGRSSFICRGGVVRNRGDIGKTVELTVTTQRSELQDFLRFVLKGKPPMTGGLRLNIKLAVAPGKSQYADRLTISGTFNLSAARFSSPAVQEKIDDISRRGQGKPKSEDIEDVPSDFSGKLRLAHGLLRLNQLTFGVPGADLSLDGTYNLNEDAMDFHGVARTRARVSQMVKSRWKSVVLKAVDPFFAKDGAGAVFRIAITGTRKEPRFGLDRSKPEKRQAIVREKGPA